MLLPCTTLFLLWNTEVKNFTHIYIFLYNQSLLWTLLSSSKKYKNTIEMSQIAIDVFHVLYSKEQTSIFIIIHWKSEKHVCGAFGFMKHFYFVCIYSMYLFNFILGTKRLMQCNIMIIEIENLFLKNLMIIFETDNSTWFFFFNYVWIIM